MAEDTQVKKLKDYGSRRILLGHKHRCPLSSVELIELYMAYLDDRNKTKRMCDQEFETFCNDLKKLIPRSKGEKLRGKGYIMMKMDLQEGIKRARCKFNYENQKCFDRLHKNESGSQGKHAKIDPGYMVDLKEDEVGLEDLAKIVSVENNFLLRPDIRKYFSGAETTIPKEVCDQIFTHYDTNRNNWLSQVEIMALLRDIFCIQRLKEEMVGKPISTPKEVADLLDYTEEMCIKFSTNLDGMLTYSELEKLLNAG